MMTTEELTHQLKKDIIEILNLDIQIENFNDDDPLFIEGIGLDSIDALELVVLLDKKYKIKLKNPAEGKKIFTSVKNMAIYIQENQPK